MIATSCFSAHLKQISIYMFFTSSYSSKNKTLEGTLQWICCDWRGYKEEQTFRLRSCSKAIVKVLITLYLISASYSCCCCVTIFVRTSKENLFPFLYCCTQRRHVTKESLISRHSRKQKRQREEKKELKFPHGKSRTVCRQKRRKFSIICELLWMTLVFLHHLIMQV